MTCTTFVTERIFEQMKYTVVEQSGVRRKVFSIFTGVPSSTEIELIRQFPNPDHFRGFHTFTPIRVHL